MKPQGINREDDLKTIYVLIKRFHSRGQNLCKFIVSKESVYIRKEFNSHKIGLEHQYGRRFIVWNTNMAAVTPYETLYWFHSEAYMLLFHYKRPSLLFHYYYIFYFILIYFIIILIMIIFVYIFYLFLIIF